MYKLNPEGEEKQETGRLPIEQNEEGIDIEDRILKYCVAYNIVREDGLSDDNEFTKDMKFHMTIRNSDATGYEVDGKHFLVMKGSRICLHETPSLADNHKELRRQLMDDNVIKKGVFEQDYTFSTISAAACVVSGRSANGWTEWISEDGRTYQQVKHHI